jgi:hypothetical protein
MMHGVLALAADILHMWISERGCAFYFYTFVQSTCQLNNMHAAAKDFEMDQQTRMRHA